LFQTFKEGFEEEETSQAEEDTERYKSDDRRNGKFVHVPEKTGAGEHGGVLDEILDGDDLADVAHVRPGLDDGVEREEEDAAEAAERYQFGRQKAVVDVLEHHQKDGGTHTEAEEPRLGDLACFELFSGDVAAGDDADAQPQGERSDAGSGGKFYHVLAPGLQVQFHERRGGPEDRGAEDRDEQIS